MNLQFDPSWTFKQVVYNSRALKHLYEDTLRSFSYFQINDIIDFQKTFRNSIYSLDFEEWKKDRIWEYINGFESLNTLFIILNRQK